MGVRPEYVVLGVLAAFQLAVVAWYFVADSVPNVLNGAGLIALLAARGIFGPSNVAWYVLVLLVVGLLLFVVGFIFLGFPGGMIKMAAVSSIGFEMMPALTMAVGVLVATLTTGLIASKFVERGTLPGPLVVLSCTWVVVAVNLL